MINTSIPFEISQLDSIITLPIVFPITTKTKFRNQQVKIQIEVPVGKEIFINDPYDNFQHYSVRTNGSGLILDWNNDNGDNYFWRSGVWYNRNCICGNFIDYFYDKYYSKREKPSIFLE